MRVGTNEGDEGVGPSLDGENVGVPVGLIVAMTGDKVGRGETVGDATGDVVGGFVGTVTMVAAKARITGKPKSIICCVTKSAWVSVYATNREGKSVTTSTLDVYRQKTSTKLMYPTSESGSETLTPELVQIGLLAVQSVNCWVTTSQKVVVSIAVGAKSSV